MCLWETHRSDHSDGSDHSDRSDGSDKSDESDEVLMMMGLPFFYLLAFTVAESMIFPWRSRSVRDICLLSTVIDMAPTI